jgi:hypothetical protein
MLLNRKASSFEHIAKVLDDYRSNIGDAPGASVDEVSGDGELTGGARQRDIIARLSEYLRSC